MLRQNAFPRTEQTMSQTLTASAPGSIMISGEHAVVYGAPAIVCAIEQRLHIRLRTRADRQIRIASALATHHTDLATLEDHPKLRFIIAALRQNLPASGLDIAVRSELDPTLGLGTSAAVTAAMTFLLYRLRGQNPDLLALHRAAYRTILTVQQRGSGADLAASLAGGIIAYQNRPFTRITPLPAPPAGLSLRYAGYKTPTAEVLARIAACAQAEPAHYRALYERMGVASTRTIAAAEAENWQDFYNELNAYQELLAALGVCDDTQAVHLAAARPHAHAVKISGSGLGDCILALADQLPPEHRAVTPAHAGVRLEAAV